MPRTYKPRRFLLLFFLLFVIYPSGCASLRDYIKGDPKENVFVYGYIRGDVEPPSWIQIIQVYPKDMHFNYSCWTVNGVFIQGNLRPGSYQLGTFGGSFESVDLGWAAPGFQLSSPGAYFLGSYRIVSKGLISKEYSLEKTDTPDEAAVLRKAIIFARGSLWESVLSDKLKTLEEDK